MTLTKDEASEIKKQLLSQVEKLNQPNKDQIKKYIEGLDGEQLEEFLDQQGIQYQKGNLEQKDGPKQADKTPSCIFCSIVKGTTPSYKILENKKAIAILDINPLSKGHSIVIPVNHGAIEELPKSALTMAQKLAKKIKKKLKAEDVKIESSNVQGHSMMNIIPFYKEEQVQRKKAEDSELKALKRKLEIHPRSKRKKPSEEVKDDKPSKPLPKMNFRIP